MNYIGNIFRPPVEHDSILLQVTTGCSYNRCSFCGMYRDKAFTIKNEKTIERDIDEAAKRWPDRKRVFLCDGDALALPTGTLARILEAIHVKMPHTRRITAYAGARGIRLKSDRDLSLLRGLGLSILYVGLESGDDRVLAEMNKGVDARTQIDQIVRAKKSGMKASITVLLGLGAREGSLQHAKLTGKALTAIDPEYVGALSLMVVPGTELFERVEHGTFSLSGPHDLLTELRVLVEHTDLTDGTFSANHASNFLPLQARFPNDKQRVIETIDAALAGKIPLKPERLRAL